jgi:RES domain
LTSVLSSVLTPAIQARRVRWAAACRIVPTRYPAVSLFDRVADEADFNALYALEALTNERVRNELGQVDRVPAADRIYGPGSGPVMAAFTHVNTEGSRFSSGDYGVFYAARDRATAVAETRYHHGRFLAATAQPAMHLPMRLYHVAVDAKLHDLRLLAGPAEDVSGPSTSGITAKKHGDLSANDVHHPNVYQSNVYHPSDYTAARALGAQLNRAGSAGVVYRSVRHAKGQCAGLFSPRGASACLHAAYLLYAWDGQAFADVYEKAA